MSLQPVVSAVTADVATNIFYTAEGRVHIKVTYASGNTITKGMVVAEITASDLYGEYNDSGSGGLEVAKAVADDDCDASSANQIGSAWIHGTFYAAKLTGMDANARTDLGVKQFLNDTVESF